MPKHRPSPLLGFCLREFGALFKVVPGSGKILCGCCACYVNVYVHKRYVCIHVCTCIHTCDGSICEHAFRRRLCGECVCSCMCTFNVESHMHVFLGSCGRCREFIGMYVCMYVCMYECVHCFVCSVCACACVHAYLLAYAYIYMYVCVYVCI
jgi:hypothetical protein